MNTKSFLVWSIIGAAAAIFILNILLDMTYSREGSFDIITGALVETFVLTCFYQYFEARQTKKENDRTQQQHKHITSMLEEIQKQIRSAADQTQKQIRSTLDKQQQKSASSADPQHSSGISIADRLPKDQRGMISEMFMQQALKDGDIKAAAYFEKQAENAKRGDQ